MNLVEWKNPPNKPDTLIQWLSKNSITNGAKLPITIDDFFRTTTKNFLFPELNCLVEFFKFNFKIDTSVKNKLIINSIKELIIAKKETSDNLLNLIIDKTQHLILQKETKYCLISLSVENIPFKKIQIYDSEIKFYKKFPTAFKSRKSILSPKSETNSYTKCVIKTYTSSNEINVHMDNLDVLRALINLYTNSGWGIIMHKNPEPINKVRLGQFHTLHNNNGDLLNQNYYYEPKFIPAPLENLSKISKKRIEKDFQIISRCNHNDVIKESLLLFTRSLDEWDLNISLTILWNAIEILLSRKGKNESSLYKIRCSKIFRSNHIGECLDALRWIRNNFVHNYDNYHEARKLTYQLIYIYREILAFHLSVLKDFSTSDLAIDHLDKM